MHKMIAGAALTGALELVGHWAPWPKQLHRVAAYTWGVGAILAGVTVVTERRTWLHIALLCATGGAATVAGYLVDLHLRAAQRRRMYERHA